ncbi:MAG TPA: hypothetical protein VEH07_04170, partial [Alphaproteobacteria bacterium]|nr:hypothetical protein [Alphaproteobacteria bacterium]
AGDPGCLKICADRLSAPIKGRSINFVLPELKTISDAIGALATITDGLTDGRLLPEAAEALTVSVMAFAKVIELNELEARLTALEQARDQQDVQSGARYDA